MDAPRQLSPAALHWMARCFPFLKSAEQRPGVQETELSECERRTGARFLSRSTAVGDDRFSKPSQPFNAALHRLERDGHRAWNMACVEAGFAPNVYDGHRSL
jgi:hypothetical protein